MIRRLNLIRQSTMSECGLCCIAMLSSYYGYKKPIHYYRNEFNLGRDGCTIKDLYLMLDNNQLSPKAFSLESPNDFDFEVRPYILLTKDNHFVVIKKINRNNKFNVYDPASGQRKIDINELNALNGGILLCATPSKSFVAMSASSNEFRNLNNFFKKVIPLFISVIVSSLLVSSISMVIPTLIEIIINNIHYQEPIFETFIIQTLLVVLLSFFTLSFIQNTLIVKLQQKLNHNITTYTISHLLNLPYSFFDDRGEGNILYRLGLLPQLVETISTNCVQAIINFLGILVITLYTIYRFPQLIYIILPMIIILGVSLLTFNTYLLSKMREEMLVESKFSEIKTEIITMMFQIKASRLVDYFNNYYKENFEKYNLKKTQNKKKVCFFDLIITTYTLFVPFFAVLYSINQKNFNVGELFFIYSIIGMVLSSSNRFFSDIFSIFMIKPSLFYLNDIYDESELIQNGKEFIKEFEKFEVKNVSFQYTKNGKEVLKNINLSIKKGQKVSIVGVSGSGKSTLIKLLSGLYTNYQGCILINGYNIYDISQDFFTNQVSVVPQNPTIFYKTIRDNITLENKDISDDEVWEVLDMVNMTEFIKQLPMGLNTIINSGDNFSGGQGQRISLARALIKKPNLLILDEATSSLDVLNEKVIFDNLKQCETSILVISHRLFTIIDSDVIYMIDNGEIKEQGNHSELITKQGIYANLYENQN